MPAPYSKDLRAKAIAAYKSGRGNQRAVAELFGIGEASLRRWLALERDTGTLAARPPGPRPGSRAFNAEGLEQLRGLVAEMPDGSAQETVHIFKERHGLVVSRSSVHRVLVQLGLTRKKRRSSQSND